MQSTAIAHMTQGAARVQVLNDPTDLRVLLDGLDKNQAITCGVPTVGDTALTTRAGAEFNPDAVARTNEAFRYPDTAALFPIDVDIDGDGFQTVDGVLDALEAGSQWLQNTLRIARPSSSSYVGGRGLRGVHVYIAVTRGADIPALAKRMQIEQWAVGRGHVKVSRSGALLVRQLSDALVYQPSRLMFEAAPVLNDGITRDVPDDQAFVVRAPNPLAGRPVSYRTPEGFLDVQALPPLRSIDERRFETATRAAKDAKRAEAKRVAIEYQTQNAIASGLSTAEGERYGVIALRALGDKALPADWPLNVRGIGIVTAAQVVANGDAALGFCCADPFDTHRTDLTDAHLSKAEIVRMGGVLGVWSHKLQTFFKFLDTLGVSSPLEVAAEKLCGLIEYPERVGKRAAPFVNVKFAVRALLDEIDARVETHAATGEVTREGIPSLSALIDALSRIGCAGVTPATIETALDTIAAENAIDPWRDAVLALPQWDGTQRLDTFFVDLCDALPSDALTATTQLLFAGILKRQLSPGAPLPVVPVLIGGPGTGKTRFVEQLAAALGFPQPPALAFSDTIRMTMEAATSGVAEMSEMSGMGKRDVEEIKLWITDTSDTYRAPYGRRAAAHPRRFALVGTANKHELNRDETGNRRFMPVFVNRAINPHWNVEALQVFAEAKARFVDPEGEYARLVRRAPDLVKAYNDADMREGIGTPATALSELAPDVVRELARRRPDRRVYVRDMLTRVSATCPGRSVTPQQISAWMRMQGWASWKTDGLTAFAVPETYLNVNDDAQTGSPFNTPATV